MYTINIDATHTSYRRVMHVNDDGTESFIPEITVMIAGGVEAHDGRQIATLLTGRYTGGPSIEVFVPWDEHPNGEPIHEIEVWDDRDGTPTIPCTVTAVTKAMTTYVTDVLMEEVFNAR